VKVSEEVEIVGFKPTEKKVVTGCPKCSAKILDSGEAGDNVASCSARGKRRRRARQVLAKPGSIQAAHEVQGRGLHPVEGRGRAVTRRSSTATARSSTSAPPT